MLLVGDRGAFLGVLLGALAGFSGSVYGSTGEVNWSTGTRNSPSTCFETKIGAWCERIFVHVLQAPALVPQLARSRRAYVKLLSHMDIISSTTSDHNCHANVCATYAYDMFLLYTPASPQSH